MLVSGPNPSSDFRQFMAETKRAIDALASVKLGGGASPTFYGVTLSGLTASRLVSTDSAKALTSTDLVSWVSGTANEVNITDDGDGTITIGIVDPLIVAKGGTGVATLTDHGILLGSGTGAITPLAAATNGQLPIGSTGADPVLAGLTGTANRVTVTNGAGSITLTTPQDTHTGASPTFTGLTLSGLTASKLIATDGSKALVSSDLSNWVAGTANRVTVTDDGDGTITLTGPQDIATSSNVQFGTVGIGKAPSSGLLDMYTLDTTTAANVVRGIYIDQRLEPAGASSAYLRGMDFFVRTYSAFNFANYAVAVWGAIQHRGTGTLAEQYGMYIAPVNYTTGTITTQYGIVIPGANSNAGGTVTTYYGLKHSYNNVGTLTNKWFIYDTSGFDNYFNGQIGVGTTSPQEDVHVIDTVRADTAFNLNGTDGLSGTLTLDDGANWRITLTFSGGILTGQSTGASSAATATWV